MVRPRGIELGVLFLEGERVPLPLDEDPLGQVDIMPPNDVERIRTQGINPRELDSLHEREVLLHEEGRDGMGRHGGVPEEVVEERVELAHAQGSVFELDLSRRYLFFRGRK